MSTATHFLGSPWLPYSLLFCVVCLALAGVVWLYGKQRELKEQLAAALSAEKIANQELENANEAVRTAQEKTIKALEEQFKLNDELQRTQKELERALKDERQAKQRIHELATHDQLTGALNRHGLEEVLQELAGRSFSILLVDADKFKRVNDEYGHDIGDDVLKSFAEIIRHHLKNGGVLIRFGGEEFIVLLPDTILVQAIAVGERLRAALDRELHLGDLKVKISASIGVATAPQEYDHEETLAIARATIKAADLMVYDAKEAGRNCVRPQLEFESQPQ